MKNSSYEERKQIIRPSDQDLGKMYQKAPIRQILSLKLSTLQQLILLNFFSHDYDVWKLSINGISKSFGNAKNRKNVAAAEAVQGCAAYGQVAAGTGPVRAIEGGKDLVSVTRRRLPEGNVRLRGREHDGNAADGRNEGEAGGQ